MKAPRGKFLGGSKPDGNESSPLKHTKPPAGTSAAASPKPPKRIRSTTTVGRQEKLFSDLDEAESLALDLLELASSTALSLSNAIVTTTTEESEDIFRRCEAYGDQYTEKVKRIHSLLSPHARLVVSYKNHVADIAKEVALQDQQARAPISQPPSIATKDGVSGGNGENNVGKEKGNKEPSQSHHPSRTADLEELITSPKNMYAARVELRLALERRDILREMVRLEKERLPISR